MIMADKNRKGDQKNDSIGNQQKTTQTAGKNAGGQRNKQGRDENQGNDQSRQGDGGNRGGRGNRGLG